MEGERLEEGIKLGAHFPGKLRPAALVFTNH